jgi:hypothetical protein
VIPEPTESLFTVDTGDVDLDEHGIHDSDLPFE